jgi:transposase-like protein
MCSCREDRATRRYGVSDNAIRKWIRAYEGELASAA